MILPCDRMAGPHGKMVRPPRQNRSAARQNLPTARKNQRGERLGKAAGRFDCFSSRRALSTRPRELVNTWNGVWPDLFENGAGCDWFSAARDTRAATTSESRGGSRVGCDLSNDAHNTPASTAPA